MSRYEDVKTISLSDPPTKPILYIAEYNPQTKEWESHVQSFAERFNAFRWLLKQTNLLDNPLVQDILAEFVFLAYMSSSGE